MFHVWAHEGIEGNEKVNVLVKKVKLRADELMLNEGGEGWFEVPENIVEILGNQRKIVGREISRGPNFLKFFVHMIYEYGILY